MKNEEGHSDRPNSANDSPTARRDFLADSTPADSSGSSAPVGGLVEWARDHSKDDSGSTSEHDHFDQPTKEGRLDTVSRAFAGNRTRRGVLASLTGGLLAMVGVRSGTARQSTVPVCYRHVTLDVSDLVADALLARGATEGACPEAPDAVCYQGVTLTVSDTAARYLLDLGATPGACNGDGPQGPQGPQGCQGCQGPQGIQGPQGLSRIGGL